MGKEAKPELAVISKTYDLVVWSCRHLVGFPRSYRFSLGERLERRLYDVLELLLQAKYTRERAPLLKRVNLELELLRFQFRLARQLQCLSLDSYGFAVRTVNEVGQMVGAWLKTASGGQTAA